MDETTVRNPRRTKLGYSELHAKSGLAAKLPAIETWPNRYKGYEIVIEIPEYTADVVFIGTLRLLEALRETGIEAKFYQASSSEMYGKVVETPQTEKTPFHPRSPYGVAKVAAHHIAVNYRAEGTKLIPLKDGKDIAGWRWAR